MRDGIDNLTPHRRGKLIGHKHLCSPDNITPYPTRSVAVNSKEVWFFLMVLKLSGDLCAGKGNRNGCHH